MAAGNLAALLPAVLLVMVALLPSTTWAFRSYNYYAPHQYPETGPLSYK